MERGAYNLLVDLHELMRSEWNQRARENTYFYVGYGGKNQTEQQFLATAADEMPAFEQEFSRIASSLEGARRALEIGCGPGRLMMPMAQYFGEVHGVDISDHMISLARERFRDTPNVYAHLTHESDLRMFPDEYFDFVYSYAVFQHIPSREIVLMYLREAQRVLRPGGILCCQTRGKSPVASELLGGSTTWTGCWFTADDIANFSRERRFPLVAISGSNTQYMWTTFRKPIVILSSYSPDRLLVKAVTSAGGGHTGPWLGVRN